MLKVIRLCIVVLIACAIPSVVSAAPAPAPDCTLTVLNRTKDNDVIAVYIVNRDFGSNLLNGQRIRPNQRAAWWFGTADVTVMAVMLYGPPVILDDAPCLSGRTLMEIR